MKYKMSNINNEFLNKIPEISCSCCGQHEHGSNEINRRKFIKVAGATTFGAVAMSGLSWASLASEQTWENAGIQRQSLVVKPIFVYSTPTRPNDVQSPA